MSAETQYQLGTLLRGGGFHRDAIHIAVAPVVAAEHLTPGAHVGLMIGDRASTAALPLIGIIDPFLRAGSVVPLGETCWLFLYPNTISGMRHHWEHPAFISPSAPLGLPDKAVSERWLNAFAARWNFDYDELIDAATHADTSGNYYAIARDTEIHSGSDLGDDELLFWQHLETLTGTTFPETHRANMGWSCTC